MKKFLLFISIVSVINSFSMDYFNPLAYFKGETKEVINFKFDKESKMKFVGFLTLMEQTGKKIENPDKNRALITYKEMKSQGFDGLVQDQTFDVSFNLLFGLLESEQDFKEKKWNKVCYDLENLLKKFEIKFPEKEDKPEEFLLLNSNLSSTACTALRAGALLQFVALQKMREEAKSE